MAKIYLCPGIFRGKAEDKFVVLEATLDELHEVGAALDGFSFVILPAFFLSICNRVTKKIDSAAQIR